MLYDFIKEHGGIDISDTIYDYLNYFDFTDSDDNDAYDKVMIWLAKHIEVVRYFQPPSEQLECKIAEFIEGKRKIFDKYCAYLYVADYQPQNMDYIEFESEEFYDYYMALFSDLINGNHSDKDYQKLLEIIEKN